MSGRELRFNVYDASKIGHANVSFYSDGEHQYTIGANIRLEVPQLALPKILPFEPDDGIYRDESAYHLAAILEGGIVSASVPVTDVQYDALLADARALENETFNYSVFTEACVELVQAFYDATGHPGQFGDLFAHSHRGDALVWHEVDTSDRSPFSTWPDDKPQYVPPPPIMPDPPVAPTPTVFAPMPDPPSVEPDRAFLLPSEYLGDEGSQTLEVVREISGPFTNQQIGPATHAFATNDFGADRYDDEILDWTLLEFRDGAAYAPQDEHTQRLTDPRQATEPYSPSQNDEDSAGHQRSSSDQWGSGDHADHFDFMSASAGSFELPAGNDLIEDLARQQDYEENETDITSTEEYDPTDYGSLYGDDFLFL
ncbi:MAG: hypothetical protein AAFO57_08580 [Pseudomonadota bacterium]